MHPMLIVALVGGGLVLLAWLLWWLVRRWDRVNAVVAAAAPLPIRLVNVWDQVWVRGQLECDEPLITPHFHYSCVHFTYKLEEEVTRTRRTSDGKTETTTTWETRKTTDGWAPFRVCQDTWSLWVEQSPVWYYEPTDLNTVGKYRHTCTYFPYPGDVSVVGVVGEKKDTLAPRGHVPLIATPLERAAYLQKAEGAEWWAAKSGLFFLFVGACLTGFGLARYFQTPDGLPGDQWWDPSAAWLGGLAAAAFVGLLWSLRTFNSLVVLRTRADMAWRQIDVHLQQRYELIPNLVHIVQAYARHEQKVLEELTALRGQALAGGRTARVNAEGEAVAGLTRVFALAEAYPDLKANANFLHFANQITALEDKIAHARGFSNEAVKEYNLQAAVFPASLIASLSGFRPYPLFAAELDERAVPRLKLDSPAC